MPAARFPRRWRQPDSIPAACGASLPRPPTPSKSHTHTHTHAPPHLDCVHAVHAGGLEHRVVRLARRVQDAVGQRLAPHQDAVQVALCRGGGGGGAAAVGAPRVRAWGRGAAAWARPASWRRPPRAAASAAAAQLHAAPLPLQPPASCNACCPAAMNLGNTLSAPAALPLSLPPWPRTRAAVGDVAPELVRLNLPQPRKPLRGAGAGGSERRAVGPQRGERSSCSMREGTCVAPPSLASPGTPSQPAGDLGPHLQHADLKLPGVHAVVGLNEGVACGVQGAGSSG